MAKKNGKADPTKQLKKTLRQIADGGMKGATPTDRMRAGLALAYLLQSKANLEGDVDLTGKEYTALNKIINGPTRR